MKKLALIIIVLVGLMVPLACSNNNPTGPLATYNLTVTPTNTCTSTPTNWAGYTSTATPGLGTYTPTLTFTSTATNTSTVTQTGTLPPTNTFTNTATNTATATPTNTSTAFSTPTPAPTGLNWITNAPPNGLAYNGSTTVYVAEGEEGFSGGQIQTFTVSTGTVANSYTTIGTYTFGQPNGVAYSTATGDIYVVDQINNAVYAINPSNWTLVAGSPVTSWAAVDGGPASFSGPQGIAINSAGTTIYVADSNNDYVEVFDTATLSIQEEFGGSGTNPGELNNPDAIAINSAGAGTTIYVADATSSSVTDNQRIQIFNSSYAYSTSFTIGSSSDIVGMTLDTNSPPNIYVADAGLGQVEVFNMTGTLLTAGLGVSPAKSPSPDGLVFIGSNLLVADYANNQLYLVTP